MEQWLILSNTVNYIQYDRCPKNSNNLNIEDVNKRNHKRRPNIEEEKQMLGLDFGDMPEKLKGEYLDIYNRIQSEILSTTRFDENSNLSTIYLGRVDTTRASEIKLEETFLISEQGFTVGKLLDATGCQILSDTRASKSFMSKSHYLHYKSIHSLPKFTPKTQRIQVSNGQFLCFIYNTNNCRYTHTQIRDIYISIRNS